MLLGEYRTGPLITFDNRMTTFADRDLSFFMKEGTIQLLRPSATLWLNFVNINRRDRLELTFVADVGYTANFFPNPA